MWFDMCMYCKIIITLTLVRFHHLTELQVFSLWWELLQSILLQHPNMHYSLVNYSQYAVYCILYLKVCSFWPPSPVLSTLHPPRPSPHAPHCDLCFCEFGFCRVPKSKVITVFVFLLSLVFSETNVFSYTNICMQVHITVSLCTSLTFSVKS